jgi:hypothetical protein
MDHRFRLPARILVAASLVAAFLVGPEVASPASACATQHGRAHLSGFSGGADMGSAFYVVSEDAGSATATVTVTPAHCQGEGGQGRYQTSAGTATAPSDFTAVSPTWTPMLCRDDHPEYCPETTPPEHRVNIPITNDGTQDGAAVESFRFELTQGNPGLAEPTSAPVHIVDANGPSRVSVEPELDGSGAVSYQQSESPRPTQTVPRVRIPLFWAGSGQAPNVNFTVEPDPASPATPGEDYNVVTSSPLTFTGRMALVEITVVNDTIAEPPESVTLEVAPGTGYAVASPGAATFSILDNEEGFPPTSRFHHPRQGWKYLHGDIRLREMHTISRDVGVAGVVGVEIALRQRKVSGACRWWDGDGFVAGACGSLDEHWVPMRYLTEWDDVSDLYERRFPALAPSIGTKISNYTAWTRAEDGAGNVEDTFERGRNLSTFEVRRG